MGRITKQQYENAKASLPKLRKAEEIVTTWEKAVEGERKEVTSINVGNGHVELTYRKAVNLVESGAGREAA